MRDNGDGLSVAQLHKLWRVAPTIVSVSTEMQLEAEQQIERLKQLCHGSPQIGASPSPDCLSASILTTWFDHLESQLSRRSSDPLSTQLTLYGVLLRAENPGTDPADLAAIETRG